MTTQPGQDRHGSGTPRKRYLVALLALLGVLSVLAGALTATAHTAVGPHRADLSLIIRPEVRIELGPLGTIAVDSPLPPPLGVQVDIHEVPAATQDGNLAAQLGSNVAAYAALAAHPEAALAGPRDALIAEILGRSAVIFGLGLHLLAALWLSGRAQAFAVIKEHLHRPVVAPLAVAVTATVIVVVLAPTLRAPLNQGRTVAALANTPFANIRVVGQLGPILDAAGGAIAAKVEETDNFYAAVTTEVRQKLSPPAPSATYQTVTAQAEVGPQERTEDIATILFISDLHCNVALASTIGTIADQIGADLIINGGDTATSGFEAERFCVDMQAAGWGETPVVVADGNHDSIITGQQEEAAGWNVLRGKPITVAGLTFLGDSDPTLTVIGQGTHAVREESKLDVGERIATASCDQPTDIVVVHDPIAAKAPANKGCAPLWLAGHMHKRIGPTLHSGLGPQVRFVNAATGRGLTENTVIGKMNSDAEMTIIRYDRTHRQVIDLQIIAIRPDATLQVEPRIAVADLVDTAVRDSLDESSADSVASPTTTKGK